MRNKNMAYNPEKPYKDEVLRLIKQTWKTPYVSVYSGAYPVFRRKFSGPEVDHTDGVGTKGIYHWKRRTFRNAVLDALAMNLNDLVMSRSVPYKLQCHLILPKDDHRAIVEIMKDLVKECKDRNIAITGGETSIQNNVAGLDISLTVSGFVRKERRNQFRAGDVLVGFASNGLHSNGFTAVRRVFSDRFRKEFTEPTRIYSEVIGDIQEKHDIHGMMHITGGAFTKLKSLLVKADAVITGSHSLRPQRIFQELYDQKISDRDMYKTFNCGIGFVIATSPKNALEIITKVKNADIVGEVVRGLGRVRITSMFSGKKIQV